MQNEYYFTQIFVFFQKTGVSQHRGFGNSNIIPTLTYSFTFEFY